MQIRPGKYDDVATISEIYSSAREFMKRSGNPDQWADDYPSQAMIIDDIASGCNFVLCDDGGEIHAVFMYRIGPDPTYAHLFGGNWLNDETYGTIHRIASDGTVSGVLAQAIAYADSQCANLRIDTHAHNTKMLSLLPTLGFVECGVIELDDGSLRTAFHRVRS
ncbi:GNAT family N-acetyltransferase [Arcanobacterium pinnipediorum]|uniref:N-acetyltransferase n=1 Tax=Arcanobacterium pinnipediorum TaxID=1503041 RepID=A0ABY5AJN0_9ACTO|nr:GNAT family N-acetyltransferase [Arcanobacterium pinnipediorum]USR80143.1 N-acetyltransferase [Arcanobacterium pinnipediorum]